MNISQSTIKLVQAYEAGEECGHVVKAKLAKTFPEQPSKAMKLGNYFEYLVFGTIGRHGIPQPEYMVSFLKKKIDPNALTLEERISNMLAPYRTVHAAADKVAMYLKKMGIKILSTNERIEKDGMSGNIDVRVSAKILDGRAVIDTKYTSLMNDKWNKFGWSLEVPQQVEFHGLQAKHYHLLTGDPVYYLVTEAKKKSQGSDDDEEDFKIDIRFYKAQFNHEGLQKHIELVNDTRTKIETNEALGWTPRPMLVRCESCPLFNSCNDRAWHPPILQVDFN